MSTISGYLVVLARRGTQFGLGKNPRYRGIYRMPMWPSPVQVENPILEEYVFSATDDYGFIPTEELARSLCNRLRSSPREFEIIYCIAAARPIGNSPARSSFLGYDIVPVGGDFLSIVGCPPDDKHIAVFLQKLNESGLFDSREAASAFLTEYQRLHLAEWEVPRMIFEVDLVVPNQNRKMG